MKKRLWAGALAAVMVMTSIMPAWAAPKTGARQDEYARVTVENVKGGYFEVTVGDEKKEEFLPIGSTAEVPVGTKLNISHNTFNYGKDGKRIDSYLKKFEVSDESGEVINEEYTYDPNNYRRYLTEVTVESDTVITGTFANEISDMKYGDDVYIDELFFQKPLQLKNEKMHMEFDGEEGYWDIDGKDTQIQITEVYYDGNREGLDDEIAFSPEDFTIADGCISSKEILPMGSYDIAMNLTYRGTLYEDVYLSFQVGYDAQFGVILGQYKYNSSNSHYYKIRRNSYAYDSSYDIEDDSEYYFRSFFDGQTTKVSTMFGYLKKNGTEYGIYGYERTGWVDEDGNKVSDSSTLAEAYPEYGSTCFYGTYKKGNTPYEPVTIRLLDDNSEVKDGWVQENGRWYYFENGEPVVNEWKKSKDDWFYLGSDGAMVTDGIAGTGDERYLVDTNGKIRTDFTGEYTDEKTNTVYDIENGKVIGEHITVATPASADKVKDLADQLVNGAGTIPEEDKPGLVDKLIAGLEKLPSDEKEKLTKKDLNLFDQAVKGLFTVNYSEEVKTAGFAGDEAMPDEAHFTGAIAAAGLDSSLLGEEIDIRLVATQKATKSNADRYKEDVRFDVRMYVNDKEVEPKTPVAMEIGMPEVFVASYSNAARDYRAVHEKKDGTKKTTAKPDLGNDGSVFSYLADSFSEFAISSAEKKSSGGGGSSSGSGSRSISNTVQNASGTWIQDDIGWWFSYTSGGYPASKWERINGKWYYFDTTGYMMTGWQLLAGKWYYLDPVNGDMVTGWKQDAQDHFWYYLDLTSGAMKTGWQSIGGKWYYFNPSVTEETGWVYDGTARTWNYRAKQVRPTGSMYFNETTPDGYQVNADGVWAE